MKKTLMGWMMLALVFVLAACGTSESGNEKAESNAAEEVNVEADESSEATEETADEEEAAASDTVTVKHELGEAVVPKNPENVVVFDYGVLDTLQQLGVEPAGLPKGSTIPEHLSKFEEDAYANAGTLFEPDFELVNELKPELIIISGRASEAYEDLQEIAPTIYLGVDATNYMDSFKENMRTIGEIFEKEDEVESEIADVEASVAALKEKAEASEEKALILLANDGSISAYGSQSRFGLIHDEFGFALADENIEAANHGMSVTFEYVLEKNPEILFVIDRGAVVGGESSAKEVVENEIVKQTAAYENGNIVYLDPNYWYLSSGGLEAMKGMLEETGSVLGE
ncbi:siderophore ABC transporter substrate-binding protein [Bacillaceae bacterium SIJ1]|uniref:siderophore ABC transporter substrate-binding protein n=1 Tax=Litoribacterium kuwaitense TaxID=1398745 RepID=UPI0013E9A55E|nr:siderophore ABC transporter substrate-binding protein [Litoribacterium kuwaitense]NGP44594.1 siderophore ABC transporter substrate-binding protein [Litoribacterium kuwaitense]